MSNLEIEERLAEFIAAYHTNTACPLTFDEDAGFWGSMHVEFHPKNEEQEAGMLFGWYLDEVMA